MSLAPAPNNRSRRGLRCRRSNRRERSARLEYSLDSADAAALPHCRCIVGTTEHGSARRQCREHSADTEAFATVNGIETSLMQIDTSEVATDTIDYVATDTAGLTATSTRTVLIEAATVATTSATSTQ